MMKMKIQSRTLQTPTKIMAKTLEKEEAMKDGVTLGGTEKAPEFLSKPLINEKAESNPYGVLAGGFLGFAGGTIAGALGGAFKGVINGVIGWAASSFFGPVGGTDRKSVV